MSCQPATAAIALCVNVYKNGWVPKEYLEKHCPSEKASGTGRQEGHLAQHIICQHDSKGQLGERNAAQLIGYLSS